MAMSVRRVILALCTLAFSACAFSSTGRILKASSSVEVAERAEAEKYAIYELTRAREYLHKAREEYGYSDFEAAEKYAVEAISWADKARDKARDHEGPSATPTPPPVAPPAAGPAAPPTTTPPPTVTPIPAEPAPSSPPPQGNP